MSQHRQVAWVEREDKIYLMVLFENAKDKKFNVDPKGIFTLSGSAGADNNCYELKLELFDKVDVEKSIVRINNDVVFCILMKAEKKWWNKLLRGGGELPDEAPTDGMGEKSRTLVLRVAVLLLRGAALVDGMNGIYRYGVKGDVMDVVEGNIRAASVGIGGSMGGGTGGIGCSCRGPVGMVFDIAGLCKEDGQRAVGRMRF